MLGGSLIGLLLTERPAGALVGGTIGTALTNQPHSLEAAVRSYFGQNNLPVISFYRLGPKAAMVLFQYLGQFWTVTSHVPDNPNWTTNTIDDWLYGDIVDNLRNKLAEINVLLTK